VIIYLADLTHTGLLVASNVFPLAIGLIGANIKKEIPDADVELFKYPADLDRALSLRVPDVFGISNYSWNCNLGNEYLARIKERWPHVVTIAGGPNYGSTEEEQEWYWKAYPHTDFYIYKEGEQATVQLLAWLASNWGRDKNSGVPSTHHMQDRKIIREPLLPRIKSLDDLPSPYTEGLMDKFFDGVLIPMTHTTRGCPFKCSFCTEGTAYYDQVAKRTTLAEDLDYIGQRRGTLSDLYISDANFGMFKEDKEKAYDIAHVQAVYGWPKYIHVSGGKNQKERVLEVAAIIGGSMGVAASLQSTNANVLQNIRRSNISTDELAAVARQGSRIDANTYAEIILNLPGDTIEAHIQSLRDAVNTGLSYLRMYQLIMLPETDMNTRETREKFGMKCHWRIMPRCFGRYSFQGESFDCAEIEEICTSQDSLSFEDYLDAREWDLTVTICHNANVFRELFGLCSVRGVEWFQILTGFHERRRDYLCELYDTFRQDTIKPLWSSREEAVAFASTHLDQYLNEQMGTNELFNANAVAFFNLQEQLHAGLYTVARGFFPELAEYLHEAEQFSLARKRDLLEERTTVCSFSYDFGALVEADFAVDPNEHKRRSDITFTHSAEQRATIDQLVHQYGTSTTGLGRILLRAHVKRLFRVIESDGITTEKGFEASYRRSTNLGD
jgi:radical SAM superfamily enzyme YgiQ (UPF0313 family)